MLLSLWCCCRAVVDVISLCCSSSCRFELVVMHRFIVGVVVVVFVVIVVGLRGSISGSGSGIGGCSSCSR